MNKEVKEIEEGHGLTDVSCAHGSRWIWWPGPDGKGKWEQVVYCSNCDCSDPPRPFKSGSECARAQIDDDDPVFSRCCYCDVEYGSDDCKGCPEYDGPGAY